MLVEASFQYFPGLTGTGRSRTVQPPLRGMGAGESPERCLSRSSQDMAEHPAAVPQERRIYECDDEGAVATDGCQHKERYFE